MVDVERVSINRHGVIGTNDDAVADSAADAVSKPPPPSITASEIANVARLESKWVVQNQVFGAWQSNPLVVDGVMYLTQRPNDVMAVDARTGSLYFPGCDGSGSGGSTSTRGFSLSGSTRPMRAR